MPGRKRKTREPSSEPEEEPIVEKKTRRQGSKRKAPVTREPDSPAPVTKKRATRSTRSTRATASPVKKKSTKKASTKKRTTRVAAKRKSSSTKSSTKKKSAAKKKKTSTKKKATPVKRAVRSRRSAPEPPKPVIEQEEEVPVVAPATRRSRRSSSRRALPSVSPSPSPTPVRKKKASAKKKAPSTKKKAKTASKKKTVRTPKVTATPRTSTRKVAAKTPAPSKGTLERKPRARTPQRKSTNEPASAPAVAASIPDAPLTLSKTWLAWTTFAVTQCLALYGALMTGSLALQEEVSVVQQLAILVILQCIAMSALGRCSTNEQFSSLFSTLIATEFIYFTYFSWDYIVSFNLDYIVASSTDHNAPRAVITTYGLAYVMADIFVEGGHHTFPQMLRNLLHVSFLGWLVLVPADTDALELRRNLLLAYMLVVMQKFAFAFRGFHQLTGYTNMAAIFGYVAQLLVLIGIPYMAFLLFNQSEAHTQSLLTLGFLATDGMLFALSSRT